jgi:hypothetical protein
VPPEISATGWFGTFVVSELTVTLFVSFTLIAPPERLIVLKSLLPWAMVMAPLPAETVVRPVALIRPVVWLIALLVVVRSNVPPAVTL